MKVQPAPTFHQPDGLTDPEYWDYVRRHDPRYHPSSIVLDVEGQKVELKTPLEIWGSSTLVLEGVADLTKTQIELDRHMRGEQPLTSWVDGHEKAAVRIIATHYAAGSLGPVRTMHTAIVLQPRKERAAGTIMYWRYYSDSIFNYLFKIQVWGVTNTYLPPGGLELIYGSSTRKIARVRVMLPHTDRFSATGYLTSTPKAEHAGHMGTGLELVWNPGIVLEERPYDMTDGAYVTKANINQNVRFSHHRGTRLTGPDTAFRFDPARGDRCTATGKYKEELDKIGFSPKQWIYYPFYDGSVYIYDRYPGATSRTSRFR